MRKNMLEIYLGKNRVRNKTLLEQLGKYGVPYITYQPTEITREIIIKMMKCSPDCFDFLSTDMLRYKRREDVTVNTLVDIVLKNTVKHLRLPIIVQNNHVYADVSSDDVRAFIPRKVKVDLYRKSLREEIEV